MTGYLNVFNGLVLQASYCSIPVDYFSLEHFTPFTLTLTLLRIQIIELILWNALAQAFDC